MRSQDRIIVPSSNRAWKVNGSVWVESGRVIYKDETGTEKVLSTLQYEVCEEPLVEDPNSLLSGVEFTTLKTFTVIKVYRNGMRMRGGGNDYTVTGNQSISLVEPVGQGENLFADYYTEEI